MRFSRFLCFPAFLSLPRRLAAGGNPVQCADTDTPCILGAPVPDLPNTIVYTSPTTISISGWTEVILPTTDGRGSSIDITGIITTNSLGQPSTSYLPITHIVTQSSGSGTFIQLPLTNGQGSIVIATGFVTSDSTDGLTTSFLPLTIINSVSTGQTVELVLPTTQSGNSVGFGLGTISSGSHGVQTLINGTLYQPPIPQATATGSLATATTTGLGASGTQSRSDELQSDKGRTNTKTRTNGATRTDAATNRDSVGTSSTKPSSVTTVPGPNGQITPSTLKASSLSSGSQAGQTGPITTHTNGPITPPASLSSTAAAVPAAAMQYYPSTVTFVTTTDGSTVVGVAFVTTTADGGSTITNSIPQQSAVGTGEVAVTMGGTTTTITLSDLPSPTPLPHNVGVDVVVESGVPVTYSPRTLTGYANLTAPFMISTTFVETVDGHTTTQAGWWLIGPGGVISPPSNKPWKPPGGDVGCLEDPNACDPNIVIIGGGWGIHIPGLNLPKGTIGPPGYPGGKVSGGSAPGEGEGEGEPPPPYEEPQEEGEEDEDEDEESSSEHKTDQEKTDQEKTDGQRTTDQKTTDQKTTDQKTTDQKTTDQKTTDQKTTDQKTTDQKTTDQKTTDHKTASSKARPSTNASRSPTRASTASGAAEYFIVAATGAMQAEIGSLLKNFDPSKQNTEPDVGDTPVSGGTWINYELDLQEVQSLSSRSDILLVHTCANFSLYTSDGLFTTMSYTQSWTASLITLEAATGTSNAKVRREAAVVAPVGPIPTTSSLLVNDHGNFKRAPNLRFHRPIEERGVIEVRIIESRDQLEKRDPGNRLVRQIKSNKDLSVLSQAPGVPNVDDVDYIFEETKGENTWVYLVDSGVEENYEFQDNWDGLDNLGKRNIDDDWLWAPDRAHNKEDWDGHGTCMASKICGTDYGAAKQTTIIPVVVSGSYQSTIAGLELVLADIQTRRNRGQCLAGKTVVSMSWGYAIEDQDFIDTMRTTLKAIMNLGVVVVNSAGNDRQRDGWKSKLYPKVLQGPDFPLLLVGAVDIRSQLTVFSQLGDIYAVGLDAPCANKDNVILPMDSDGSSGACAVIAGLIAYLMGKQNVPFDFGTDITQYQKIVYDYFATGPGGHIRPGGTYRVAWNGEDGSAGTVCPLTQGSAGWGFRKRDGSGSAEQSNICGAHSSVKPSSKIATTTASTKATPTGPLLVNGIAHQANIQSASSLPPDAQPTISTQGSIAVWTLTDDGCSLDSPAQCNQTYQLYSVAPSEKPADVCDGEIAAMDYSERGLSIPFEQPQSAGGSGDFTYYQELSVGLEEGWVRGEGIPSSVACSWAPQPTRTETCRWVEKTGGRKRRRGNVEAVREAEGVEGGVKRRAGAPPPPPAVLYIKEAREYATCDWGLGQEP